MLSKRFHRVFRICTILASKCGAIPLSFDKKGKTLVVSDIAVRRCWRSFWVFCILALCAAYQGRFWQRKGDLEGFNQCLLFFYGIVILAMSTLNWIWYRYELADFVRLTHGFLMDLQARWFPEDFNAEKFPTNCRLDRAVLFLAVFGLITQAVMTIHLLTYPEAPIYITSILPGHLGRHLLLRICVAPFYFLVFRVAFCHMLFHLVILFTYGFHISPLVSKDFRANLKNAKGYRTPDEFRSATNLPNTYRSVELLHNLLMFGYCRLLRPLQAMFTKTIMIALLILIRYGHHLTPSGRFIVEGRVLGTFGFWSVLLKFGGYYFTQSKKTLQSWRQLPWKKEDLKYLSKFKKSCRPLRIAYYNGFFRVANLSLLKFWKSISRYTLKALIAFK